MWLSTSSIICVPSLIKNFLKFHSLENQSINQSISLSRARARVCVCECVRACARTRVYVCVLQENSYCR